MTYRPRHSVSWRGYILTGLAFAVSTVILGAGIASASPAPGTKLATLKVSGTNIFYGTDVSISGNTAVVSQDSSVTTGIGRNKVFAFTRTAAGWKHSLASMKYRRHLYEVSWVSQGAGRGQVTACL